ncbi:hypothetical protein RQM65_05955 [Pricia sp. S334]|uniref:Uncharacterized protein n=1 Tax=Pricia mediterranea TaxID=3076079 RepID=A0ABU3L376_9FLAO|nr:hypothetical protein [Pricia sp. S334]MDT7828201.1 hypothetical protein [Pricia sp. S334]
MKVSFRTKEESNREQRDEFLKLPPVERIYAFLDLMDRLKDYPTKAAPKNKDNFLIEITSKKF